MCVCPDGWDSCGGKLAELQPAGGEDHRQQGLRGQRPRLPGDQGDTPSVADPYSLNPDPDPAKNLNTDTEDPWIRIQAISLTLSENNLNYFIPNYKIFSLKWCKN